MDQFYQDHYQFCPNCGASTPDRSSQLGSNQSTSITCSQCGFTVYQNPAPAVGVIITNHNRLLLAKRNIEPFKHDWDLPGGFVDIGETPEQACVRELLEEANLEIKVIAYVSSYPDRYQQYPTLVMGFTAEIAAGEPKPADDVAELKWFDLDQLPENIAFGSINRIIKDYLRHRQ